ncbi:MFS transporter [Phaeobacter sp. HF9A]|uniref:MFS transporter n=1 Tax=Phaeobacter sp. HF9A TaxID=2721561 RepID=UPI0014309C1D|nr:MFS transporter [Phaeobacter sp. HF9A]NIZ11893.1 MFS transporter [Phaeobacter sp. HF9A]
MASRRIMTVWQVLGYGLLTTPLALTGFALVIYVPTFYAVDVGLGLGAVGAVFVAGRLLDVVSDPLIGHLSDRTRHRAGPRLVWIVAGLPGFIAATWLLLNPPEGAGLGYLVAVSALFFLFYTVVDVPYSAIGIEISPDVHERSYLAGAKALFQVLGALVASIVPVALAAGMGVSLRMIAIVAVALAVLGVALLVMVLPPAPALVAARGPLLEGWRAVLNNRSFRRLAAAFFIVQAANALTAGLMVLFLTHVIGAPDLVGQMFLLVFAATAVFLPLWISLSRWRSKRFAWGASVVFAAAMLGFALTLGPGQVMAAAVFSTALGAVFGADAVMPTSMLADIVSDEAQSGDAPRAASFLAVKNAVSKLTFVVPMGLAFPVLGLVGFDKAGPNDAYALGWLALFYAGLPLGLRLLAFMMILRLPVAAVSETPAAAA